MRDRLPIPVSGLRLPEWTSVVLIAAVLAGFAWFVLRPHEPFYRGRPLTAWLHEAVSNGDLREGVDSEARKALQETGSEALPLLKRFAGERMSGWRIVWRQTLGGTIVQMRSDPDFDFLHLPPLFPGQKAQIAFWGFKVLGAQAAPAVPALVRWLNDDEVAVREDAAFCLAEMGPAAADAVPGLCAVLQQRAGVAGDARLRRVVCFALGQIGDAARPAIPQLTAALNDSASAVDLAAEWALLKIRGESPSKFIERLNDTSDRARWSATSWLVSCLGTNAEPAIPALLAAVSNRDIRIQASAVGALGQIHARPDLCLPVLIPLLNSTNLSVRQNSIWAIRGFGSAAEIARPEVMDRLSDSDPWVQRQATNALRALDRRPPAEPRRALQ